MIRKEDLNEVLLLAACEGDKDIVELNEGLLKAAKRGYTDLAELLITKGADIDTRDAYGDTPLIHAAWKGRIETVKMLIARGADVNAQDTFGNTALILAADHGYKEIVKLLQEAMNKKKQPKKDFTQDEVEFIAVWEVFHKKNQLTEEYPETINIPIQVLYQQDAVRENFQVWLEFGFSKNVLNHNGGFKTEYFTGADGVEYIYLRSKKYCTTKGNK